PNLIPAPREAAGARPRARTTASRAAATAARAARPAARVRPRLDPALVLRRTPDLGAGRLHAIRHPFHYRSAGCHPTVAGIGTVGNPRHSWGHSWAGHRDRYRGTGRQLPWQPGLALGREPAATHPAGAFAIWQHQKTCRESVF